MAQESFHLAARKYLYETQKNKERRSDVRRYTLIAAGEALILASLPVLLEANLINPTGHSFDFLGLPINRAESYGALASIPSAAFASVGAYGLYVSHQVTQEQKKRDEKFRQQLEEYEGYYPGLKNNTVLFPPLSIF